MPSDDSEARDRSASPRVSPHSSASAHPSAAVARNRSASPLPVREEEDDDDGELNEKKDEEMNEKKEKKEKKVKSTSGGGFKWKEKKLPRENEGGERDGRLDGRLERGYRDREEPVRRGGNGYGNGYERRDGGGDRWRDDRRDDRRGGGEDRWRDEDKPTASAAAKKDKDKKEDKEKKKEKKKKPLPVSNEPMIIVTVNDRLGTKAQIPCLASDSVKAFKAMVAAHIGRAPHEIMLKRQGERPFKDVLSLEDYGVSHGVQLDLELDTGD